jgi:hypothetical protein
MREGGWGGGGGLILAKIVEAFLVTALFNDYSLFRFTESKDSQRRAREQERPLAQFISQVAMKEDYH